MPIRTPVPDAARARAAGPARIPMASLGNAELLKRMGEQTAATSTNMAEDPAKAGREAEQTQPLTVKPEPAEVQARKKTKAPSAIETTSEPLEHDKEEAKAVETARPVKASADPAREGGPEAATPEREATKGPAAATAVENATSARPEAGAEGKDGAEAGAKTEAVAVAAAAAAPGQEAAKGGPEAAKKGAEAAPGQAPDPKLSEAKAAAAKAAEAKEAEAKAADAAAAEAKAKEAEAAEAKKAEAEAEAAAQAEEKPEKGEASTQAPGWEAILEGAVIERGQAGETVRLLQERLTRLGFGVQATGVYGETTEQVVRAFQAAYRVEQTGKVGPTTLRKLMYAEQCAISLEQLLTICPGVETAVARRYLPFMNASMEEAHVDNDARKAAYVAQLAHETDGFNTLEEYASGSAYEGREDLGNTERGDGRRYKGRGAIQLTGRANYRSTGDALGVDLEANPELAATPELAFRVSARYWTSHGLNQLADDGDYAGITQAINGGQNGRASREAYHAAAERALEPSASPLHLNDAEVEGPKRAQA